MKLQSPEFRILLGSIGFFIGLAVLICSGFAAYNPDPTIAGAMIGFSSVLLTAGLVKKFSKNNNLQSNE